MSVNKIFATFSVVNADLSTSSNSFSPQKSDNLSNADNQAIARLTERFRTDAAEKPKSVAEILDIVLKNQPLDINAKRETIGLDVKYPKSAKEMMIADYKMAVLRAEYARADLGMLTDAEIMMSETALAAKGFTRKWYGFENLGELQDFQKTGGVFTTEKAMIQQDVRGGQAVLQYRRIEADKADAAKLKNENETNQMLLDPLRLGGNFPVRWAERTLNTPRDLLQSTLDSKIISTPGSSQIESAARAGFKAVTGEELPAIPTKGELFKAVTGTDAPEIPEVKLPRPFEYQTEKYKRDGKTGEEVGATAIDLLLLKRGMTGGAKSPQSLKTLGGIPEVEAAAVVTKTSSVKSLSELFKNKRVPKASELKNWAEAQGWTLKQNSNGPLKYIDDNNVTRLTIKKGSPRAAGSGFPHVEIRDAAGQRVDVFGNPVTRKSVDNHTLVDYDL